MLEFSITAFAMLSLAIIFVPKITYPNIPVRRIISIFYLLGTTLTFLTLSHDMYYYLTNLFVLFSIFLYNFYAYFFTITILFSLFLIKIFRINATKKRSKQGLKEFESVFQRYFGTREKQQVTEKEDITISLEELRKSIREIYKQGVLDTLSSLEKD